MKKFFSVKSDLSPLVKLALPLALTGMTQSAGWFFETLFLAHLDAQTLAAGSLVSWLFGTLAVILFGILSSINILTAHKQGANDHQAIIAIARDGLLLAVLLAIPATILFWNMAPVFLLFGQSEVVVMLATSYLHPLAWGFLADLLMIACLEVIVGLGHARAILVFSILSVALNIFFSYIFIFGKLGFTALGIAGAGWGMTTSYWISAILLFFYIITHKEYRGYFGHVFKFQPPCFLRELLQIGLPIGIMYCVEVGFFFALTLFVGLFGSHVQAANQVALQYLGLLMTSIFSIAQAITVRMGHLIGAKNVFAAEKAAYLGIGISVNITLLAGLIYWLYPDILIAVDFDLHATKNSLIIQYIKEFLLISAVFQIFEAIRIAFFGALRGIKDTRFTLLASIISFWCIAIPVGYLFAFYFKLNATGFWWGMVAGAVVSVFLLQWRFAGQMRKLSRTFSF